MIESLSGGADNTNALKCDREHAMDASMVEEVKALAAGSSYLKRKIKSQSVIGAIIMTGLIWQLAA